MTEQSPPPLDEERVAVTDAPKKPWSKPTILRITDAALETGSGPSIQANILEGPTYTPAS